MTSEGYSPLPVASGVCVRRAYACRAGPGPARLLLLLLGPGMSVSTSMDGVEMMYGMVCMVRSRGRCTERVFMPEFFESQSWPPAVQAVTSDIVGALVAGAARVVRQIGPPWGHSLPKPALANACPGLGASSRGPSLPERAPVTRSNGSALRNPTPAPPARLPSHTTSAARCELPQSAPSII